MSTSKSSKPAQTAKPDDLPTLETADLSLVTGGTGGFDMSSMMPMIMMMAMRKKQAAAAAPPPQMMSGPPPGPVQPPAPVLPRIFVNGVEQHFDGSSGGTLSTTSEM